MYNMWYIGDKGIHLCSYNIFNVLFLSTKTNAEKTIKNYCVKGISRIDFQETCNGNKYQKSKGIQNVFKI